MRRARSLAAAEEILLRAERLHPTDGTILFNLACYAAQRGELATARAWLTKAIAADERFRAAAETDEDLAPLRESAA